MTQRSRPLLLVVDDVAASAQWMQGILVRAGYEVLTADNGAMALEVAASASPDLILLDVMMPGMDGFAVCQQLKSNAQTRKLPVIFVTARDDIEAETQCFALGAVDFIAKPFNIPVVLARLKMHLALERQRRNLEGMFENVIEFAPDAFVLCDPDGDVLRINRRAEQLFGYGRDTLVGRSVAVVIPNRLCTGTDLTCLRQDGTAFPADINVSPLQTDQGSVLMAVVRDVTDRHKAQQSLQQSRSQLRKLVKQREVEREMERKHLAREVHDELGQLLTGTRMELTLLEMRFGSHSAGLVENVQNAKALLDRAIQGVRNVVTDLRPAALDMGLIPALQSLCTEFTRRTGTPCTFHSLDEDVAMDEERSVVIFRIVQESLTNAMRHAQARGVWVTLGREGAWLGVEVGDDGQGFDRRAAGAKPSFGLLGMRERARGLGGRVDIVSAPGLGTVVGLSIPLSAIAEKEE